MKSIRLLSALALALCLTAPLRADALDDELEASKKLLLSGSDAAAADRLDALEARARVTAAASPTDAHAKYILGMAAMYAGHDDIAKSALDIAAKLEPKNPTYAMGRAQLALYQDDPKPAIAALQTFIAQGADNEKNTAILEMLGDAQSKDGQLVQAQKTYQKAADLSPKEARFAGEVAKNLADQHKDDEALAAYQKTLDIDPKYLGALTGMGQLYQSRKAYDQSLDLYTRVVAINPADFLSIAKLVQLNQALGKSKERDAARDQIFALYKTGKIEAKAYCRDVLEARNRDMLVLEYFDFKNPTAIRYAFNIVAADGQSIEKSISLGTDEATTAKAREKGDISLTQRLFHLDVYIPTGHELLGTFLKEPTYEETRDMVKQYLAGTLKIPAASAPAAPPAPGGAGK